MKHRFIYFLLVIFIPIFNYAGTFDNLQSVLLADGMQFTEGPVWHPDGYLVFSDANGNTVYKWSDANGLETYISDAKLPNGIDCNRKNELFICSQGLRDILKMDRNGNKSSFISNYNGKKFNSPNDVLVSYTGSVYFTDPDFGINTALRELNYEGIYCVPFNNSSTPFLLDSTLVKPNGLTFVYDWRTLFVCESSTNTVYSYGIKNETQVDLTRDKKVFLKYTGTGEIDGITSDVFGNIYVACGNDGVHIYDKSATEVGKINFPTNVKVRNLCFGGKYKNQLYITAGTGLYRVEIRFWGDFVAPGLLGAPTDKSVIFNAVSDKAISGYLAWGTDSTQLTSQTITSAYNAEEPIEIQINGLNSSTRYYYQFFYKLNGDLDFKPATKGSFITQRNKGENFSFAIEADPHLDEASNYITFRNALQNMASLKPDFLIDLGDNFMTEKFPLVNSYYIEQRNLLYRNFWDKVCSSIPLYMVIGNHEGELRWLTTNQADDEFNLTTSIRKKYYPNPVPNDFYSGNTTMDDFVGQRENYYSWTWGDVLFVVIDPYAYTTPKPSDEWGFTLGETQYNWFADVLKQSNAKYKFVFAHQLIGGNKEGRGGAERVDLAEMGGKNSDGTDGFSTKRPGWSKPLHQLMVENGVQIFFHGHDHLYAEQLKDGIVYQEVPQPSFPQYTVANDASTYGYVSGIILPNSGHLNVQILGDSAQVSYIGAYHLEDKTKGLINRNVRRSYFVKANKINTDVKNQYNDNEKPFIYRSGNDLIIKSNKDLSGNFTLYNVSGQAIETYNGIHFSNQTKIKLNNSITSGIYIASIQTSDIQYKIKIKI